MYYYNVVVLSINLAMHFQSHFFLTVEPLIKDNPNNNTISLPICKGTLFVAANFLGVIQLNLGQPLYTERIYPTYLLFGVFTVKTGSGLLIFIYATFH